MRGFWENVLPFFPSLRLACAHQFLSLGQVQCTVAQRAKTTVAECSLTSCFVSISTNTSNHKSKSNSPFITRRLSFEEDEKKNQVERSGKVNIRKAEVLAVGEEGKAIFSPTPTLNIEPFDSFEFSAKGTVIYVLIVS